jgi:hypothetical protein
VVLPSTWSTSCCTPRHSERTEQSTERLQTELTPLWSWQKPAS